MYRSSILSNLHEVPNLREDIRTGFHMLVSDEDGVGQHEGGEQEDPLMPLLFSVFVHNALAGVKEKLFDGEFLFAFLDDVCAGHPRLLCVLPTMAGMKLHTSKTRKWNHASVCPLRMAELGPAVWSHEGIKIFASEAQNSFRS